MKKTEHKDSGRRFKTKQALIITSLVVVLALGVLFGQGLVFNPVYATVSVDVNPSLELSLNRQLRVVAVRALNEDARQLMAGQALTGLPWEEAAFRWVEAVKSKYAVKAVLLAAVMPENAAALKSQLMEMEKQMSQIYNQGDSNRADGQVQAKAIYSNDRAVRKQARDNSLSIGRQMMLNQARIQEQNYTGETIGQAPITELLAVLMQNDEPDQTRLTIRETQSLAESVGSGATEANREANREQVRETSSSASGTPEANREANREQVRETSSSASGTPETVREQARETSSSASGTPETVREQARETSCSASGTPETVREQARETSCSGFGTGTPETSCETVRETNRETLSDSSECTSGNGPQNTSGTSGNGGSQTQAGGSGNGGN